MEDGLPSVGIVGIGGWDDGDGSATELELTTAKNATGVRVEILISKKVPCVYDDPSCH